MHRFLTERRGITLTTECPMCKTARVDGNPLSYAGIPVVSGLICAECALTACVTKVCVARMPRNLFPDEDPDILEGTATSTAFSHVLEQ